MPQHPRIIAFLASIALLSSSCSWMADSSSPNTSTVQEEAAAVELPSAAHTAPPAKATSVAAADRAQTAAAGKKSATCEATKPGQVVGFEEFYQATLNGDDGEKRFISAAPGAPPGDSYGLAGESVEAMATALDETCEPWLWLKWPDSDYRGWLPASVVQLER